MSLEKTVVTLKLQSGKRFDGIAVKNAETKLSEFLDGALKQLEVGHSFFKLCGRAGGRAGGTQ